MRQMAFIIIIIAFHYFYASIIFAQSRPYEGPDDPASDIAAERAGWMTGNRVLLFFRNTTELGDCCDLGYDVAKWPNNFEGSKSHDGYSLLIGARVPIKNDSIPVTNHDEINGNTDLDTLYFIQASYRVMMEKDPTGTIEWAFYPVFGYFNELSETPAMSNREDSWPPEGWPARGNTTKWPGEWNGRFGRGVMKADQECYFVANDAHDQEYLGPEDRVKYFPRRLYDSDGEIISDVRIGDKKPDVTVQKGLPWGGIGIRAEVRGFQWSNPSAMDAIFWEYTMANTSEYDLQEIFFGLLLDNAVGGEEYDGADDNSYFNKRLNLCYSWDLDGIPMGGGKTPGVLGVAYLESPGIPYDDIDNDQDGLLNEKRDNEAVVKVGPFDGLHNLADFLSFYNLEESDLKEHWDADEDQDWRDGIDANNNKVYDIGEDPGDDLGLDGVGPYDLNYEGPDVDGTECNHKPDLLEGVGAEPNFGLTDVNESDMLGLTTFRYCMNWSEGYPGNPSADQKTFEFLSQDIFDELQPTATNYLEEFASGLFPLHKGLTERISMSELHAYDPLAGLNSSQHKAPALFRLKEVVQLIYESDYRFAQPPLMPALTATPGDGKVILHWDDKSDKFTRDSFVKNANDFEGYKLYRSTDPFIADPMIITDGYGSETLRQPIFQCDKIDNKKGFTDFGLINGMGYYLGDDSGLYHAFTDNTVQNGQTYYYVLVAYDYGIPEVGTGIPPSENTFVLEVDENENIHRISPNVAVVRPNQIAAGYQSPGIEIDYAGSTSAAQKFQFKPEIYDNLNVKKGHTYKVKLIVNEVAYSQTNARYRSPYDALFLNDGINVYDVTLGDSLIYQETRDNYVGTHLDTIKYVNLFNDWTIYKFLTFKEEIVTDAFDGVRLRFQMPFIFAEYDTLNSGWLVGDSPINIHLKQLPNPKGLPYKDTWRFFPWYYEIVWTDNSSAYTSQVELGPKFSDHEGTILSTRNVLLGQTFDFYVLNKSFTDSTGAHPLMDLVVYDVDQNGMFNADSDYVLVGDAIKDSRTGLYAWSGTIFTIDFHEVMDASQMPRPNDVYRIDFKRPFYYSDSLMFTVTGLDNNLDKSRIKTDMEKIRVVPNPYVVTNTMEAAVANWQRNQRRQLMFTHIPAQCKITIFTISGVLIDEIEVDNAMANRENVWDLNSEANGTVHWDLRSKEGLEIAAGYYVYHVESKITGDVKVGKFAVIK